ncbi:MAG: helix-turn-helix domain-containing protein [Candidatus Coprovivens sp.]
MSIVRVHKTKDYTIISNYHLREKNMSLKAKGLLSLMLSLPEDWDYSIDGLISICKENESAINSTLKELKEFGYLEVIKKLPNQTNSGRIEYEYNVYEIPFEKQESEKQDLENLGVENIGVDYSFNRTNSNINKQNTDYKILNNNNINNNSLTLFEQNDNKIEIIDEKEVMFNQFWKAYPKRKDKQGCLKKFKKIKNIKEIFPIIMLDIEEKKKSPQWQDSQFIPYSSTYLNQKRWEDSTDSTIKEQLENIDMSDFLNK